MSKVSFKLVLINLVVIGALLALEWYETHGGPVVVPPKSFLFVILMVSPLTTIVYALQRCRPRNEGRPQAN